MMNRVKVTAAGLKEISRLAPQVASEVAELCKRHHTRRVNFCQHASGWQMYLAEGTSYEFFPENGKSMMARMLSADTIGSKSDGINYYVGAQTPAIPEGTWIVEFQRFMGTPYITVHYVGQTALSAA
jgi:hypothetical protein